MGVVMGGSIEDVAQAELTINFSFEPKETTKYTLSEIFRKRDISDDLRSVMRDVAEEMALNRHLLKEAGTTYVFSKNEQQEYFWKQASARDHLANKLYASGTADLAYHTEF